MKAINKGNENGTLLQPPQTAEQNWRIESSALGNAANRRRQTAPLPPPPPIPPPLDPFATKMNRKTEIPVLSGPVYDPFATTAPDAFATTKPDPFATTKGKAEPAPADSEWVIKFQSDFGE